MLSTRLIALVGVAVNITKSKNIIVGLVSGGSRGDSLGSKEPPFCSLNNRKMGVVWLKVGVFHGKLMKRTSLVRVLDPPLLVDNTR